MLQAFTFLERLRDHGLFLFRVTVGGTMLFYSLAELTVGGAAWGRVGDALRVFGAGSGAQLAGLAALLWVLLCGGLLVLGLWTRGAAVLLGAAMAVVAVVRWPEVFSGTLQGASCFFYPVTLVAGLGLLATTGGGRYGLDAVRRARRNAKGGH
ncbi:MAG: hypothetical protein IPL39_02595 [Opitutaceae bacterium]|nr:hypothetical protein [Opitutaceae bacterium]